MLRQIGQIVQKRILFLLLIFGLAVAYSIVSLDTPEDSLFEVEETRLDNSKAVDASTKSIIDNTQADAKRQGIQKKDPVDNILPYEFDLVGISDVSNDEQNKVLIKFENELYNYEINDFLLNTNMQLVKISALDIDVLFEQIIYKKELIPPNLLSKSSKDHDKSYTELMNMKAKQISSRPRIIEHLVELTPTPYIADGKLASPGLNPDLFEQAGFRPDDVLKTINGKSVTVESEFEAIKEELKTAQTLQFLVMRKGRLVTLYLDIPSETLELARD